jgi:hypothetical protein
VANDIGERTDRAEDELEVDAAEIDDDALPAPERPSRAHVAVERRIDEIKHKTNLARPGPVVHAGAGVTDLVGQERAEEQKIPGPEVAGDRLHMVHSAHKCEPDADPNERHQQHRHDWMVRDGAHRGDLLDHRGRDQAHA